MFSIVGNYLRPSISYRQLIFNINAVVLILINLIKIDEIGKMYTGILVFCCILEK